MQVGDVFGPGVLRRSESVIEDLGLVVLLLRRNEGGVMILLRLYWPESGRSCAHIP